MISVSNTVYLQFRYLSPKVGQFALGFSLIQLRINLMSSMFKKLSKVDKKQKYCVYGWIREMEQALDINHVPLMISSICILYFHEEEMFDGVGDHVTLSKDKKCITNNATKQTKNYGIIEISSNEECIYQWDLKLNLKACSGWNSI